MLTTKRCNTLKPGTVCRWSRPGDPPATGKISVRPDINNDKPHHVIEWEDGQITDARDDWALEHVEVVFTKTCHVE